MQVRPVILWAAVVCEAVVNGNGRRMTRRVRLFLGLETLVFAVAALIHFEVISSGYRDEGAGIAASVIGGVLLLGLIVSWLRPEWTRQSAIAVQGFALLGTFVGVALLFVVGPRTARDIAIHLVMVLVLVVGLAVAIRAAPD